MRVGGCFLGSVYRPPSQRDATSFFGSLAADIARYQRVIVGGDFNLHIKANGDMVLDANGQKMLDFCTANRLHVVNLLPCTSGTFSRVQHKEFKDGSVIVEQSTLDYVLVSDNLFPVVSQLLLDAKHQLSDHKPLVLTTRSLHRVPVPKPVLEHEAWLQTVPTGECKAELANELDTELSDWKAEIAEEEAEMPLAQSLSAERAAQLLQSWTECVQTASQNAVGRKTIRRGTNPSRRWFSPELRKMKSKLDSLRASIDDSLGSAISAGDQLASQPVASLISAAFSEAGVNFVRPNGNFYEEIRSFTSGNLDSRPVLDSKFAAPNAAILPSSGSISQLVSLSGAEKSALWVEYKALHRQYKTAIRRARNAEEERTNADLENAWDRSDHKRFWKLLRGRKGFYTFSSTPAAVCDKDGRLEGDPEKALEIWTEHFRTISAATDGADEDGKCSDPFDSAFKRRIETVVLRYALELPTYNPLLDGLFTDVEFDDALSRLKVNAAGGQVNDTITNGFLVSMNATAKAATLWLINRLWVSGTVPKAWKEGTIVPLFKKGGLRALVTDYRGISLTPCPAKLLEQMLLARLTKWSDEQEIIVEEQAGFRSGRGTIEQIFVLHEIISLCREKKQPLFLAFLDCRRAYDSVWRAGLLFRLWRLGVRGRMWGFLRSMLSDVTRRVAVDGRLGSLFEVLAGVPQGAVLSPWLYSVFINGLADELRQQGFGIDVGGRRVAILLYADDIVLLAKSADELKAMLRIAALYASKWQFRYNCAKSNVVVCATDSNIVEAAQDDVWQLGSGVLEVTDEYKYLGIETSQEPGTGRWKSYVDRICESANFVVEQIIWASTGTRPLKPATAVHLWKSLARPILEYGDALWAGCLSNVSLECIEKVQTKFGRLLLTLSKHAPAVFIRSELGLPSMASRAIRAALKFYGKLTRMPATRLPAHIFRLRCDQVDRRYYDYFDRSTHDLGKYSWCGMIKSTLSNNGCTDHWSRRFVPANWGAVTNRIVNRREVEHSADEFKRCTTLALYQRLPRSGGPEKWMSRTLSHAGVRVKVQLRSNCASLYDRVGARHDVPKPARICIYCDTKSVEDVEHFVAVCPFYHVERDGCLTRLTACLAGLQLPPVLADALRVRSNDCLTRLFVGDMFKGLTIDIYMKAHGIVFNYLMVIWRKREPKWLRFLLERRSLASHTA
ncbi:MAG TPA: reverse transcriptase family protein [Nitrososphaera sp.]|nr:reverse transcriptase family protein [Nitrososphaera sp.]